MHQTLRIPEILLNIFGHCSTPMGSPEWRGYDTELAALARTCRTFKEPALDVLWEELCGLSPLVRCLPEVCHLPERMPNRYYLWVDSCYSFSRPLKEAEWNTLRSYTRRVRFIRGSSTSITEDTVRVVFSLAPFDDPLFPHLRSLYWDGAPTFVPLHIAVSSLKTLYLNLPDLSLPPVMGFSDAFGERCPYMEDFEVDHSNPFNLLDSTISRLVCRWPKLRRVACLTVALDIDAISHLSSVSNLSQLEFTAEIGLLKDISPSRSKLVFSNLIYLDIRSKTLDTITTLLHCIRLPAIETLSVTAEESASSWSIQEYWGAVREACPSDVLAYLKLRSPDREVEEEDEDVLPCLTVDDIRPCTAFAKLRGLEFDLACPVSLTEANVLELVSPRMEYFLINYAWGWETEIDSNSGVTLSGLVRLLRQSPLLNHICLSIDTRTFIEIPEGMDMSFPPRRQLKIKILDSYILPEFVPGLATVLTTLGRDHSMPITWEFDSEEELQPLWEDVEDAMRSTS